MYTDPYSGIYPVVVNLLEELISPEDNYHRVHKRRIARTLHVLLDQSPSGRLLELGGSGVMTLAMKELFPEVEIVVTNFDPSQPMEHRFSPVVGDRHGDFRAYNIDLESDAIPEKSESFDWVLCCEVIEHMEIDPMFMMSEINRVLPDGGHLMMTTPNVVSSRGLTKMVSGVEPYFYMQYRKDRSFYRHNYEYSIHSLMQVLKAAGFDGSIWTEDAFEDSMPAVMERLNSAGFTINHAGDNIMTLAKKVSKVVDRYPTAIYSD